MNDLVSGQRVQVDVGGVWHTATVVFVIDTPSSRYVVEYDVDDEDVFPTMLDRTHRTLCYLHCPCCYLIIGSGRSMCSLDGGGMFYRRITELVPS